MNRPVLAILATAVVAVAIALFMALPEPTQPPSGTFDPPSTSAAGLNGPEARLASSTKLGWPTGDENERSHSEPTVAPYDRSGSASEAGGASAQGGANRRSEPASGRVEGDFPQFLTEALDTWKGSMRFQGCKASPELLRAMAAEQRQDVWAGRVERELRAIAVGIIPATWQLSVGCRSTICQVSAVQAEPFDGPPQYWNRFERAVLASPLRTEFSSTRFISGQTAARPDRPTSALVLTSVKYSSDEPRNCFPPFPAPG